MTTTTALTDLLCCPTSHEPLLPLADSKLAALNAAIGQGQVQHVDGSPVTQALSAALISRHGKVIYPIEDGIPVLIHEHGIGTTQLDPTSSSPS
jgi:uncharacterized protein YbaR (Trm112 family)